MIDGLKPINGANQHSISEVVLTLYLNEAASIFNEKLDALKLLFPESLRTEVPWNVNVEVRKDEKEPIAKKTLGKGFRMLIGTDGKTQWILHLNPRPEGNKALAPFTLSFHFIDTLNYKWETFIKKAIEFLNRFNSLESDARIKAITLGYLDVFNFTRPDVENSDYLSDESHFWIPTSVSANAQRHFFVNTSFAKMIDDENFSYSISETVRIQRTQEGGENFGSLSLSHSIGVEYDSDFNLSICQEDAFLNVLEINRLRNKIFLTTVLKKEIVDEIGVTI